MVREGRLVSLPTPAALTKGAERGGGPDDSVDSVYGVGGVTFRTLDLDLGLCGTAAGDTAVDWGLRPLSRG